MTADDFYRTMIELLHRRPFLTFTVELSNGNRIEIDRPSVAIRGGVAAFIARGGRPIPLDAEDVKQIIDAPAQQPSS